MLKPDSGKVGTRGVPKYLGCQGHVRVTKPDVPTVTTAKLLTIPFEGYAQMYIPRSEHDRDCEKLRARKRNLDEITDKQVGATRHGHVIQNLR